MKTFEKLIERQSLPGNYYQMIVGLDYPSSFAVHQDSDFSDVMRLENILSRCIIIAFQKQAVPFDGSYVAKMFANPKVEVPTSGFHFSGIQRAMFARTYFKATGKASWVIDMSSLITIKDSVDIILTNLRYYINRVPKDWFTGAEVREAPWCVWRFGQPANSSEPEVFNAIDSICGGSIAYVTDALKPHSRGGRLIFRSPGGFDTVLMPILPKTYANEESFITRLDKFWDGSVRALDAITRESTKFKTIY